VFSPCVPEEADIAVDMGLPRCDGRLPLSAAGTG
jgi:hypothetical protein